MTVLLVDHFSTRLGGWNSRGILLRAYYLLLVQGGLGNDLEPVPVRFGWWLRRRLLRILGRIVQGLREPVGCHLCNLLRHALVRVQRLGKPGIFGHFCCLGFVHRLRQSKCRLVGFLLFSELLG